MKVMPVLPIRIYSYNSYQSYLNDILPIQGEHRGQRSKLAKFLDCRVSHITQVIKGTSQFSLEFADRTADFLRMHPEEKHFFLLLVSKDRAGTVALKEYFQQQIDELVKDQSEVKRQIAQKTVDNLKEEGLIYYTNWVYSAIHLLISLPQIKSTKDLSEHLKVDLYDIEEMVRFLVSIDVLKRTSKGLETTGKRFHLGSKDKLISQHHRNWRLRSIEASSQYRLENLHFTSVYSFARNDYSKLKSVLLEAIKSIDATVEKSPQDMVGVMCLDLFEL